MKKLLVLVLFFGFISCITLNKNSKTSNSSVKQNVIFFLVDDFGWMDTSYQGSKFYETPNIDKIANESMQFEQAYAAHPGVFPLVLP